MRPIVTYVVFTGWEVGMQKVSFTRLLRDEGGLSFATAKGITDSVTNDINVAIQLPSRKAAYDISKKARKLGVKCTVYKGYMPPGLAARFKNNDKM